MQGLHRVVTDQVHWVVSSMPLLMPAAASMASSEKLKAKMSSSSWGNCMVVWFIGVVLSGCGWLVDFYCLS